MNGMERQIGALTEAVDTLKEEVANMRKEVTDLTQARASVKLVISAVATMVGIGAAISEIIHIFWGFWHK